MAILNGATKRCEGESRQAGLYQRRLRLLHGPDVLACQSALLCAGFMRSTSLESLQALYLYLVSVVSLGPRLRADKVRFQHEKVRILAHSPRCFLALKGPFTRYPGSLCTTNVKDNSIKPCIVKVVHVPAKPRGERDGSQRRHTERIHQVTVWKLWSSVELL